MVAVPRRVADLDVEGGIPGDPRVLEQVLGLRPPSRSTRPRLRTQIGNASRPMMSTAACGSVRGAAGTRCRSASRCSAPRLGWPASPSPTTTTWAAGSASCISTAICSGPRSKGSGTLGLSRLKTDLTARSAALLRGRAFATGTRRDRAASTTKRSSSTMTRDRSRDGPSTREAILFAGLERELGSPWVIALGFDGRTWSDADTSSSDRSPANGGRAAARCSGSRTIRATGFVSPKGSGPGPSGARRGDRS